MKKLLILTGIISLASCGVSQKSVMKTVSIEKDCPRENIKVLEKEKGMGRATYKVKACGETYIYKVIGTTISEGGSDIKY